MSDPNAARSPEQHHPYRVALFWIAVVATLVLLSMAVGVFAEAERVKRSSPTLGSGIGAAFTAIEGVAYLICAAISTVVALVARPRPREPE